jgi:hypothetical protein
MVFINMKTLNIESPVAQRLAQIALFERIQSRLNLDPRKIFEAVRDHASQEGEDALKIARHLRDNAPILLGSILHRATACIKGESGLPRIKYDQMKSVEFALLVIGHFVWFSDDIVKSILSKAKAEGLDPVECAVYLEKVGPEVARWAFEKAVSIIEKQREELL